jgi:hypothetical protein
MKDTTFYMVEVFERGNSGTWFVMGLADVAELLAPVWARHDVPGHCILAEGPGVWFCKKDGTVLRVRIQGRYPWMLDRITKAQHERLVRMIARGIREHLNKEHLNKEVAHEAA